MTAQDSNGNPIPNAQLYFYTNDTTTQSPVYADVGLTTPIGQPVLADGAGRFVTDIFLANQSYAIELRDSSGSTIWIKNDCNAQIPAAVGTFPFPGAVVEFYGNQAQLNAALALYWYVCDGTGATPNMNGLFSKGCVDVAHVGLGGGTTIPTGTVGGTALSIAQLPPHSFNNGIARPNGAIFVYNTVSTDMPGNSSSAAAGGGGAQTVQGTTNTIGSGATHTHTLTMDAYSPPYLQLIKLLYLGY
jgi:hypothetical protein